MVSVLIYSGNDGFLMVKRQTYPSGGCFTKSTKGGILLCCDKTIRDWIGPGIYSHDPKHMMNKS